MRHETHHSRLGPPPIAHGQAAPPVPPPAESPPAHWVLYRGSHWCSLFRMPDGADNPIFELRDVPGARSTYVLFPMPAARAEKIEGAQLVLQPSGEKIRARVV